jgi:glycosyltransferase involved in cell wall biosynthesis
MSFPTIADVQKDWRALDGPDFEPPANMHLISHEQFTSCPGIEVEYVPPGSVIALAGVVPVLHDLIYAVRILKRADENSAIICNGGGRVGKLIGLLNYLLPMRRRKIVMWESYVEAQSVLTKLLIHWMVRGCSKVVVYSRRLVKLQAECVGVPESKFVFLPYKANHSKSPPITMSIGNYIFSGGNSSRDYHTLFEAVRDTDIPVIISTTKPELTQKLDVPSNVILLAAREPAFARLMAGSRFVVLPIVRNVVSGQGMAGACNAMWHGKPVIAADDVSLSDYTVEGATGYVVPAGDVDALRQRILEFWNNPERVDEIGRQAFQHVVANFTQEEFISRLKRLAALVALS